MCLKVADVAKLRSAALVAAAHMLQSPTQLGQPIASQAQTNPQRAFFKANICAKTHTR